RFDRVGAFVLQRISANLVDDANPAAFLLLIDDCAAPLFLNHLQRPMELRAAITLGRSENISGQTLRMDAHQCRDFGSQLAFIEHNKLFVARERTITSNLEVAPFGRQTRFCYTLDREWLRRLRTRTRFNGC